MNKTKSEIQELFRAAVEDGRTSTYRKQGTFIARYAIPGETVLTVVTGKLETLKTCGPIPDQIILRNIIIGSAAETYMVGADKFADRYDCDWFSQPMYIDGLLWHKAYAKGRIQAFEYMGSPISFEAPWGESMLCHPGDFIANPIGGNPEDIYRIERATFYQTYTVEVNVQ